MASSGKKVYTQGCYLAVFNLAKGIKCGFLNLCSKILNKNKVDKRFRNSVYCPVYQLIACENAVTVNMSIYDITIHDKYNPICMTGTQQIIVSLVSWQAGNFLLSPKEAVLLLTQLN